MTVGRLLPGAGFRLGGGDADIDIRMTVVGHGPVGPPEGGAILPDPGFCEVSHRGDLRISVRMKGAGGPPGDALAS
ncbi:hypothetical protein GCM10010357_30970 [Streptomyces luteireticuli]|uniref:Uncharacterized protein n=1 Tax=Streptomyces luteireticuli TaxID=173858 RepID=A0ABP3IK39_9ACTN